MSTSTPPACAPAFVPDRKIILLVEDDNEIRGVMADLLAEHGYEVRIARDGREAIGLLEQGPRPALILLDLMMPRMHGWAVLDALESSSDYAQIPVVITSANENSARAIDRATAYLPKPLHLATLLALVEEHAGPA
jgi:CheY-like chemotaxis protein